MARFIFILAFRSSTMSLSPFCRRFTLPVILGSPSHGQEIDGESGEVEFDVFRSGPATVSLIP